MPDVLAWRSPWRFGPAQGRGTPHWPALSHLEQALAASIDAAIAAEQYAATKGFSVRFGSEDLRAMALSL